MFLRYFKILDLPRSFGRWFSHKIVICYERPFARYFLMPRGSSCALTSPTCIIFREANLCSDIHEMVLYMPWDSPPLALHYLHSTKRIRVPYFQEANPLYQCSAEQFLSIIFHLVDCILLRFARQISLIFCEMDHLSYSFSTRWIFAWPCRPWYLPLVSRCCPRDALCPAHFSFLI